MPRSILTPEQVAACLHISTREVVRMAEQRVLPGSRVRGRWQFRAGEIWNWIEANVTSLPKLRRRDRHPQPRGTLLISNALRPSAVRVDVAAKTRASVLRELAELAARAYPEVAPAELAALLADREAVMSTALEHGVAVPHPARPYCAERPILAAARTSSGIYFGERGGGKTDLYFLVCCSSHTDHLLHLGRLCRLLVDERLLQALREAADGAAFFDRLTDAERSLCAT